MFPPTNPPRAAYSPPATVHHKHNIVVRIQRVASNGAHQRHWCLTTARNTRPLPLRLLPQVAIFYSMFGFTTCVSCPDIPNAVNSKDALLTDPVISACAGQRAQGSPQCLTTNYLLNSVREQSVHLVNSKFFPSHLSADAWTELLA
ncbi:hypothetical protein QCA50_017951 [Cerrena zonata]|uniref:Uncharacterized protein n=1 Tax=Cerrena zonata TaxID=2478898 RepID=A0AAW0FI36_9APHY